MMLIQKPPQLLALASPAIHAHRRQTSAPSAVVIQATRTPGLLSLSKPPRHTHNNNRLPSAQRPQQPKAPHQPKHKSQVARAQTSDPEVAHSPSPQPRGRANTKHHKQQSHRSASQSSVRGKHGRQPSPPLPQPEFGPTSQAEATCITTLNHFDPFGPLLDNTPPSPTLSSSPSGKLARRRQQANHNHSTPSKAQPVPVPVVRQPAPVNLASSDPLPRQLPKRAATLQEFTVCDDINLGAFDSGLATPPATPTRPTHASAMTPPDFAHYFGPVPKLPPMPASPSNKTARKHYRTPSEGVFYFSDEESSTGPVASAHLFPPMKTSFSAPPVTPGPQLTPAYPPRAGSVSPSLEPGFFAGSLFQSSPSPDELPDI